MATVELLPSRRLILLDDRGDALRATWHPDEASVVLSQWKSDVCRATFQLDAAESASLVQFLVGTLATAAAASVVEPEPARREGLLDRALAALRLRRA